MFNCSQKLSGLLLLEKYVTVHQGIKTSDDPCFVRKYWEMPHMLDGWEFEQTSVVESSAFGGRQHVLLYENGKGRLRALAAAQE